MADNLRDAAASAVLREVLAVCRAEVTPTTALMILAIVDEPREPPRGERPATADPGSPR